MSNDATAVVLSASRSSPRWRKARVQPLPYLFICAFIANAASFVLPISNPANLIVFRAAMPPLAGWLLAFSVPSLLSIGTTFYVLRWLFRNELRARVENEVEEHRLNNNGKLVVASVGLMVAVLLLASFFGKDLGLPTCLAEPLSITAVLCVKGKEQSADLGSRISVGKPWPWCLDYLVMVDAMEMIGAMQYTQHWLAQAVKLWGLRPV